MDKVEQLYNLYLQNGIITSATTLDMFRAANAEQQSSLYDLGKQNQLFESTDLPTFQSAWSGGAPAVKKKEQSGTTVSPSAGSSLASQSPANIAGAGKSYQEQLLGKNFVQRMYNPEKSIANPDGSFSTHKMASAEVDGKHIAFPTIVEKNGKLVELPVNEAIDYALANNEYAQFGAAKDAEWWASGGYKKGTPLEEKTPKKQEQKPEAPTVEKLINTITPDLIEKNEEFVVPKMNYQFGPMGFKFEESGATGDWMTVTAPNGKELEVSLDIDFFSPGNTNVEAEKLKTFIRENSKATGLAALEQEYRKRDKVFTTEKDVEDALNKFNGDANSFKSETNVFLQERKNLEAELATLNSQKNKNTPEFKQQYNNAIAKKAELEKKQGDLEAKQTMLDSRYTILKRSMGAYNAMKEEQGTLGGATIDWLAEGFANISAGAVNNTVDLMFSKYVAGMDEEEMTQQVTDNKATGNLEQDAKDNVAVSNAYRINEIEQNKIPMPAAGQSYKDWWNSLSSDQKTAIVDKSNDDVKKDVKKTLLPAVRAGNEIVWGDDDTTVEFRNLKEEGFWGGAYAGVVKSLPAMIGSTSPMGWAQRTAQMYAQSTDAVNQEMENNPEFENISESEKQMIAIPIGLATAALEEIGFRNIIANKGLMNKVILGAMGKAGATTTAKTFGELVKNEVNSMAARGALTLAGAALAEAETGAAQQVAEYAIKDIYDLAKEKDMFKNPDFLTAEYVKDVAKAGAQEAVGGFLLGMPSAVGAAYTKKGYLGMDNNVFKAFEAYANDSNLQSAFVAELNGKIASGLMTRQEGKDMLDNYRASVGLFRELPDNLSLEGKKEAMNLLKERKDLERQVEGKDQSLTAKQRERIDAINKELEELPNKKLREETDRTNRTVINGNKIQVAPPEQATDLFNDEETLAEALSQVSDQEADNLSLPLRGNEADIAQGYFDVLDVERNGGVLSNFQVEAKKIVDEIFGERAMRTTDASWANDLDDNTEYELNFQSLGFLPLGFRGYETQRNEDDSVTVKATGREVKEAFKFQTEVSFNDDQTYTFDFGSMEDVPDQYRDQVQEIPAVEGDVPRKVFGIPIGLSKTEVLKDKVYRVKINGADAKRLKLQPRRAANKVEIFRNTAKSLASIFPDVQVLSFANADEMIAHANENFNEDVANSFIGNEGGAIINDESGNPIAIFVNEEVADATTLPHEVWHAILIKAFGDNPQLFEEFKNGIEKALRDNGMITIVNELDAFANTPEYAASNMQAEEWMVQLGGLLTSSGITYDNLTPKAKSLLTQIKAVFNAVAVKITGQPIFLEDATPENILEFMVTISDSMARGEDLSKFFREGEGRTGGAGMRAQRFTDTKSEQVTSEEKIKEQPAQKAKPQILSPKVSERDEQKVNEDNLTALDFRKFNTKLQISNKKKEEFAKMLEKKRPDLKERGLIDSVIQDVEKFGEENSQNGKGNPKLEKLAMHWIYNANVILPEDGYKIVDAEKVATKNKVDPFAYDSPEALMEAFQGSVKERPIDPDTIPSFTNKTEIPGTDIVVYDVADTKEGQADVRKAIDTNWGKDANPWCLAARIDGNLDRAWELWSDRYNAIDKKIAFKNGKLLCFQASDMEDKNTWWDRMDNPSEGIPNIKDLGDGKKQTVIYDNNGKILFEGFITRKTKNKIEQWFPNGDKRHVVNYNNDGKLHGNEKVWGENGNLIREFNYKDGIFDGVQKRYFENGQISKLETYKNGLENGVSKQWIPDGTLILESNYKNGERDGIYREWNEKGDLTDQISFKNGQWDGLRLMFSKGIVIGEIQYKEDKRNGLFRSFYSDGNIQAELEYKDDKLNGRKTYYKKDGTVDYVETYKDDVLLSSSKSQVKFQRADTATLQEIQKIAQRYNINDRGFGPKTANEQALARELARFGYSAKRSKPTPEGYGGGIYIVDPRGKKFNPFKVKMQRINLGGGRLNQSVTAIEGYDRMLEEANNIIEKSMRRGVPYDKIMDNVKKYVMGSKVYERADDSQREQLVRNVETEFGKRQKSAPSVGRMLVDLFKKLPDPKNITLSEKELLKLHFKDLAKGARDAKKAFMLASDQLSEAIKELKKSGKISPKQLADVVRRFSKVDMLNEDSVDRFVDYMTKVFNDAEYAEKIQGIRGNIVKARKNLKSKIGIANAIADPMRKLLAVNPTLIPDEVFNKYVEIINMFSASGAVLPLNEVNQVAQDINEILQALDEQISKSQELSIRFESYQDKVVDEDTGKVKYADTVNKMAKEDVITAEEAELMKKFKSVIFPKEEKQEKTEAEVKAENAALIDAITNTKVNLDGLQFADERELADNIRRLLKPELLSQLTTAQLNNLIKLIDNINNGYMPHYGELMFEKLNAVKESTPVGDSVSNASPLSISKAYNNLKAKLFGKYTNRSGTSEMIRGGGLFFVDQVLGNFKSKPIFNALWEKISEAQASFQSSLGKVNKKLDSAKDAVAKSFSYNANETLESSFRMMAYMIQLEYESNPGSKQVNPASAYIKETIKLIKKGDTKYGDDEIKMLQRILNQNGDVDKDALYKSFNNAEKNAIATIREINDGLTEKAMFTAAVIRGQRIDVLNNYVHLPVMAEYNPDDSVTATQLSNNYNAALQPSSKGKNLVERTQGAKAINFDVFASAQRGAKFTLLDYHMTSPIRTARKTLNEVENRYGDDFTKQQREIFNAIRNGFEESVSNVLTNNFVATSFGDAVVDFISKQGYRAVLAGTFRFIAELSSNIGFALVSGREAFAAGLKYFDIISSPDAVNIMENVKSKQITRLYHGDTLSGRFIDRSVLSQTSGVKSTTAKGVVANKANQIYNMSLKKYKNGVELIADTLISTPDRVIMRPIWFGQFATEFKKQSGVEVDFKKIAEGNEAYMRQYKDAINASKLRADEMSVLAGATDNPFMGILKGSSKANQGVLTTIFNNFNGYMTRFAIYEYTTARQGIYAAVGNGSISRKEGIALLAAVTTRMTVYTLMTNMFAQGLGGLLGDEEEEDEKTLMQKLSQAFTSTFTSLALGRNFGNFTKSLISLGVEEVNEEFLTEMRNGDYDPYRDAISFSAVPKEKKFGDMGIGDFMLTMTGAFSPALKTSDLIIKNISAKEKKEKDAIERNEKENTIRIPLEVLGNMGMIPLYKDVKKEVMNEIYKDLRNADKKAEDKKQAEKEMLHGYENREDMKRYDPELYEEVFGKNSPGYDAAQAKKKLKHEMDSLERRMKDEFYDYVPKKKGGFGSEGGFGSGSGKSKKKGGFGSAGGFGSGGK